MVFVAINDKVETLHIDSKYSAEEIKSLFRTAANIPEDTKSVKNAPSYVMKLYNSQKHLVPIGAHLPQNTADSPYNLVIKSG
jgi:hypothetical protein